MPPSPDPNQSISERRAASAAPFLRTRRPAVVVRDGSREVAYTTDPGPSTGGAFAGFRFLALGEYIHGLPGGENLAASFRSVMRSQGATGSARFGSASDAGAVADDELAASGAGELDPARGGGFISTVVVLEPIAGVKNLVSVIDAQRTTINHLLVRQALIEERERQSIGRALHDDIVQALALLRVRLARAGRGPDAGDEAAGVLDDLDAVITRVREMSFDLSPPVLQDLGLVPAMQWLAEHKSKRHNTRVEVAADAVEPALDVNTRTIVFRALRELVTNAAKHAPGADIFLSCDCDASVARVCVRDTGNGFDMAKMNSESADRRHYGLLSVEQQISGVMGSFELVSTVGEGTSATITVPLERERGRQDG